MELLFWIDALKRASAESVTVVMPYFSYAKGDKKDEPRVSIRARVCADAIEVAGANRVVIAACSERVNYDVFSAESLGVDLVGRANIRELVAWSKPPGEEQTQLLAEDYVRMGIQRLQWSRKPERQERDIASFRRDEALLLPADLDYSVVGSLSREISGKLAVARPATLGAAARISGVTPAALVALLKHVKRREDDTLTHQAHSGLVPPLPHCGRGANEPISLQPLSRTAGEGAERSEAGEGDPGIAPHPPSPSGWVLPSPAVQERGYPPRR